MHRILVLSDMHVGSDTEHVPESPQDRLRAVLDAAEGFGPFDAVLICGDVSDNGALADTATVRDLVSPYAPAVLATTGNHDDAGAIRQVFGDQAPIQLGQWVVVEASTAIPGAPQGDGRRLASVIEELDIDHPGRPAIVLHHHPVHSRSTHAWFVLEQRDAVLQSLASREVPLLMVSGHAHEALDRADGAVRFVGAPATYYGLAHHGNTWEERTDDIGALVIELQDTGIAAVRRVWP